MVLVEALDQFALGDLEVVAGEEEVARTAYVSLGSAGPVVSFATEEHSVLIVRGEPVRFGQLSWHPPGGRFHERITARTSWGRVRLLPGGPAFRRLASAPWAASPRHVVSDSAQNRALLKAFHTILRLAEPGGEPLMGGSSTESLETALLEHLAHCLDHGRILRPSAARRRHHEIMLRFEDLLPVWCERPTQVRDLGRALGVSERTLRACCEEQVGMGPHRYLRLHRLNLVHRALRRSDPATTSVASIARRYGFEELGRFAALYRLTFGQLPSSTLAQKLGAFTATVKQDSVGPLDA